MFGESDGDLNSTVLFTTRSDNITKLPRFKSRSEKREAPVVPDKQVSVHKQSVGSKRPCIDPSLLSVSHTKSSGQPPSTTNAVHPSDTTQQRIGCIMLPDDLKTIQALFGKYEIFNRQKIKDHYVKIEPNEFIGSIHQHLIGAGFNPIAIIPFFYKLIAQSLYSWYFGLPEDQKADWTKFSNSFIEKVFEIEDEHRLMVHMDQASFNKKLAELNSKPAFQSNLKAYPTYMYLVKKLEVIKLVYPDMADPYCMSMALCLLTDKSMLSDLSSNMTIL